MLGGCFGGGRAVVPGDGAPANPRINPYDVPDAVPRDEPRSKYGNPESYVVAGKTYRVMDSAVGYRETGGASWYGTKFDGRRTSSGEPFDIYKMTAAHKTLPIPAYARVTNLENGRSVVVRINDRGPFHPDRIIDLSWAAAVKLGMDQKGSAKVEVETITPGVSRRAVRMETPEPARPIGPTAVEPADTRPEPAFDYSGVAYLQVGAFNDLDNAERQARRLESEGFPQVHVRSMVVRGQRVHRVLVGPFVSEPDLKGARNVLASRGYETFVLRETPAQ